MGDPFKVIAGRLCGTPGSAICPHPRNKRNLRNVKNCGLKNPPRRFQRFHRYRFAAPRRALKRLFVPTASTSKLAPTATDLAPA
jgi:hypothetical protein